MRREGAKVVCFSFLSVECFDSLSLFVSLSLCLSLSLFISVSIYLCLSSCVVLLFFFFERLSLVVAVDAH